jgi:hypothetical protein
MAKNLKLVLAIILFLFLFFITSEGAGDPNVITTHHKCRSKIDCPRISIHRNAVMFCLKGYCCIMRIYP